MLWVVRTEKVINFTSKVFSISSNGEKYENKEIRIKQFYGF